MTTEIALVTGASRGIGQAIALALAKQGALVIGTSTTPAGAQSISKTLQEAGLPGEGSVLNVNDALQVQTVMDAIQNKHGGLSILVNNAGITRDNLLARMRDEEWDEIMDTNLKSVFRLSRAVMRNMMKARKGRIISVTSVVGVAGNAGQSNYAAAKAGIIGFTKSLAREVGSRGITVNCVAPGFIDTDMTRSLSEPQQKALLQSIPLGRLGHVDDVAAAVAFLASSGADYITGTTLHVNGGMYMG
jgi:3-oxoacyl-[acyl-carrier protein] reductase